MAYTSIIDFRHLLDQRGRIRERPSAVARRATHVARIVEVATAWPAGHTLESPVSCRCRPSRRPCAGRPYLRRSEVPAAIVWICPHCGDRGMVQFFSQTRWDLSWAPELAGDATLQLSQRDYDALWSEELNLERRALLARAEVYRDALRVGGARRHVDALRARLPERPPRRSPSSRRIARVRIRLLRVRPPVWRTVEVPASATLAQLHRVIQQAMGWRDAHEHRFRQGRAVYGRVAEGSVGPVTSERSVHVGDLLRESGDALLYDYDFGDGWVHEVRLESTCARDPSARYPRCLKGRRACPPEDIGGPWGYADWLSRRRSAATAAARRRLRALPFDPDAFDLEVVNHLLARVRLRPSGG